MNFKADSATGTAFYFKAQEYIVCLSSHGIHQVGLNIVCYEEHDNSIFACL